MASFTHTTTVVIYDDDKGKRRVKPDCPQEFDWLWKRGEPGDRLLVGTKPFKPKHSPGQRGYLHGVIIPMILDKMGFENSKLNHENMYCKLKERFGICKTFVDKNGEALFFADSMAESDTAQMSQLIDGSIRWAGEHLDLPIPSPTRVINMGDGGGI
jgi:hypothetical protein